MWHFPTAHTPTWLVPSLCGTSPCPSVANSGTTGRGLGHGVHAAPGPPLPLPHPTPPPSHTRKTSMDLGPYCGTARTWQAPWWTSGTWSVQTDLLGFFLLGQHCTAPRHTLRTRTHAPRLCGRRAAPLGNSHYHPSRTPGGAPPFTACPTPRLPPPHNCRAGWLGRSGTVAAPPAAMLCKHLTVAGTAASHRGAGLRACCAHAALHTHTLQLNTGTPSYLFASGTGGPLLHHCCDHGDMPPHWCS